MGLALHFAPQVDAAPMNAVVPARSSRYPTKSTTPVSAEHHAAEIAVGFVANDHPQDALVAMLIPSNLIADEASPRGAGVGGQSIELKEC